MSGFDVDAAVRWMRGFPTRALARRPDDQLPFIDEADTVGQSLLIDTCVYLDRMQGKAPSRLYELMGSRLNIHSSIAVQELAHPLGVLVPDDERTATVKSAIRKVIASMPDHRVIVPDLDVLGRAAILNGVICRIQGYKNDQKLRCLNDCTLFLQALKYGLVLLTRNISDFDYCLQIIPSGRVLFYRN